MLRNNNGQPTSVSAQIILSRRRSISFDWIRVSDPMHGWGQPKRLGTRKETIYQKRDSLCLDGRYESLLHLV